VARLEDQDLKQEVAVAEARVAASEANLAKLTTGNRPQDIKSAEAALASAKADLVDKQRDLARQRELLKRGSTAQATLDKAQTAFELADEAAHRAAESLSLAREGFRREDVAAGQAELNLARASLELARTKLSYATLTAPNAGVVLVRDAEPGEVVAVGTPVITMGDLDGIWLEAYLPEPELGKVRLGQAAQVSTDSYPDKRYPGRISFISSKAEFTPKTVETAKERVTLVFRTKIRLDNPGHELKPGMPGEAVIVPEKPAADAGR
jgi:HlyD family secretion protein